MASIFATPPLDGLVYGIWSASSEELPSYLIILSSLMKIGVIIALYSAATHAFSRDGSRRDYCSNVQLLKAFRHVD